MFDFWRRRSGPSAKQIERAVKKLTETHGERAPRMEAAERLLEWGTPEALFALLKRFTISSRVITEDIEEKRFVVDMLAEQGEAAVEPILRFMKSHHQVDWPVQALARILPQDALVARLLDALHTVAQSEFAAPVHRVSLVRAVHGFVTPEMAPTLASLLGDADDDVRIVAIEALAELGEPVREQLLEAYVQAEDRPRIRRRIAEIFADREWPVKGYRPKVEAALLDGFSLSAKGVIRRVGSK